MFEGINKNSEPKEPRRRGIAAGMVAVGQRIKPGINTPSRRDSRTLDKETKGVEFVEINHPYVTDVFGRLVRQGGGWSELDAVDLPETGQL